MGKAEPGSTKYEANRQKLKGLGKLRLYCPTCQKQCRDDNAYKQHTQSESHVRQMLVVGEDPKKFINDFSNQFLGDFVQLLKTGHGEKEVNANRFYQEFIADKNHIHMNSTKWPSLTEFVKHLGREGICRVDDKEDKGLHIAWIDNSPEALRRQDALRRKQAQDQGDEEIEQRLIREQIRRAQATAAEGRDARSEEQLQEDRELKRQEGEKIKLSFGAKPATKPESSVADAGAEAPASNKEEISTDAQALKGSSKPDAEAKAPAKPTFGGVSMKLGGKPQTKNVFAQAKKNALSSGSKKGVMAEQPKKMSEAERIMKEEMEKKRSRSSAGFSLPAGKKQRNS